jgi:hypothetical protein
MGETLSEGVVRARAGPPSPPERPEPRAEDETPNAPTQDRRAHDGAADLQPTLPELRISARTLLHIAGQPRFAPGEILPDSQTQAGFAGALGVSQGAVSNALGRLVDGGLLEVRLSHVRRMMRRVKVYQLTPRGEEAVRHFHRRFGPTTERSQVPDGSEGAGTGSSRERSR